MASYSIVAVTTNSFTISGDLSPCTPPCVDIPDVLYVGRKFTITGSTGNDGTFIVQSTTFTNPNTEVVISGSGLDLTVDGLLTPLPPNPYDINLYDGTSLLTIDPGGLNTTSTHLSLPGAGRLDYGEYMLENIVHLMENFASITEPSVSEAVVGELWYDKANQELKVFDAGVWAVANTASYAGTFVLSAGDTMDGALTINAPIDEPLILSRFGASGAHLATIKRDTHAGYSFGLDVSSNFTIENNTLATTALLINESTNNLSSRGRIFAEPGSTGSPTDGKATIVADTNDAAENVIQIKTPLTGSGAFSFAQGVTARRAYLGFDGSTDKLSLNIVGTPGLKSITMTDAGYLGLDGQASPTAPLQLGSYLFLGEGGGDAATASDIRFGAQGVIASDSHLHINVGASGASSLYIRSGSDNSSATKLAEFSSTGKVGIGSSAILTYDLNVRGSSIATTIGLQTDANPDGGYISFNDTYGLILANDSTISKNLVIGTQAGQSIKVDGATGNVALGSSNAVLGLTPQSALHMHSISTVNSFRMTNSATGSSSTDGLVLTLNSQNAIFQNYESGYMGFYIGSTGTSQKLHISSTGVQIQNSPLDLNSLEITNVGAPTVGTSGMSRDYADSRYLQLTGGTLSNNLTIGTTATNTADYYARVLAGDSHAAGLEAYGNSQGDGYLYVGQSSTYGGGMIYHGDATSPARWSSMPIDNVALYRRNNNVDTPVLRYGYSSDNIYTTGNVYVGEALTDSQVYVKRSGANKPLVTYDDLAPVTRPYAINSLVYNGQSPVGPNSYTGGFHAHPAGFVWYAQYYDTGASQAKIVKLNNGGIPGDVTTAVETAEVLNTNSASASYYGLHLSPNSQHLYTIKLNTGTIEHFTMSSPGILTSATFTSSLNISFSLTGTNWVYDLAFTDDGLNFVYVENLNHVLHHYTLTTAWDLTTATQSSTVDLDTYIKFGYYENLNSVHVRDPGRIYIMSSQGHVYRVSSYSNLSLTYASFPYAGGTITDTEHPGLSTGTNVFRSIDFSDDGTTMYAQNGNGISQFYSKQTILP